MYTWSATESAALLACLSLLVGKHGLASRWRRQGSGRAATACVRLAGDMAQPAMNDLQSLEQGWAVLVVAGSGLATVLAYHARRQFVQGGPVASSGKDSAACRCAAT